MDGKTKEQFRGIREAIQSGKVFQPMGMAAAKEKIQKHLNDNSKPEKDAARKTAEYWKAEHLAGNAIIETLNARIAELERQVVSGDYDYTVDEICNAYESGVGHRGRPTAHVNPYKPGSDLATAYAIGAVGDREAQVAAPAAAVPDGYRLQPLSEYEAMRLALDMPDGDYPKWKELVIADLQASYDTDGITLEDSGDPLIYLQSAIAIVEEALLPEAARQHSQDVVRDALFCVGRAKFPPRGGNVGLQWHVVGVADVPYRTCVPKDGELLFVLAASKGEKP